MKSFLIFIAISFIFILNEVNGQCGRFSLIGEFNNWAEDEFLTRDLNDPEEFTLFLYLNLSDDVDQNGFVEMKFRENSDWAYNYGNSLFPSGNAVLNGPNIPVPVGSYLVTFNCETKQYNFETVCGIISLIGEFNGWAGDVNLERDPGNNDQWSGYISLDAGSNQYDPPNIIEMKFRENADWTNNWGNTNFPSGIGVLNGPNIPVPLTSSGNTTDYKVSFNYASGAYNFTETCGPISIIGEFGEWTEDLFMQRDNTNPNLFKMILTLTTDDDTNLDHIVEVKFRENAEWVLQWGSTQFPSGTGIFEGPNIPVPIEENSFITTDYLVTFNYSTLEYYFEAISGEISIIGAFNGWNGDVPMNRNMQSPNNWNLIRRWTGDSDIKFRENNNWAMNWGDDAWPTGYGILNGPNIPLQNGTYTVSFNAVSGEYNFVNNPNTCGEIGLVGDFNEWGGTGDYPLDAWMIRDPVYPTLFTLDYTFSESTNLLFRLDADPTFMNVWGGTTLCQTGINSPSLLIPVGGASYHITFDYNSKDYCFTHLGKSIEAVEVFEIILDGEFWEPDWQVTNPVDKLIQGVATSDLNEVLFDAAYDDSFLYIALQVNDVILTLNDNTEFFVDGNNSGGIYDDHDLHFLASGPTITVITGPPGISIQSGYHLYNNGYSLEVAIPLTSLGITASEGNVIGFDIISWDDDSGEVNYKLAWNGSSNNFLNTSDFGDLIFGPPQYGHISMYNAELGDIALSQLSNDPNQYVATYEFDNDFSVVFRKDKSNSTLWGGTGFPEGNADLGGPPIPAQTGRYRINFNTIFETYTFEDVPMGSNVALTYYTEDVPVIDGGLDEYDLEYSSEIISSGVGPNNNLVQWGSRWDLNNLYIGVRVLDAAIYGTGNPWDNDGIEFFIDGNNDKDGVYDLDFDTQIIMDVYNESEPWFKADGVEITNYEAIWQNTGLGYNVEIRLGWDNFGFAPGRGRVIGWSLGNNDNDNNVGRDYQTVWYGNGNNWNNTSFLGDLQMAEGPYTEIRETIKRSNMFIYPNPSDGKCSLIISNFNSGEQMTLRVVDLSGRQVFSEKSLSAPASDLIRLDLGDINPGIYLVMIFMEDGDCLTGKIVIQ